MATELLDPYRGPIVDAHFHVYDRLTTPYEGLLASKAMDATFTPADYRTAMAGVGVEAGVVLNVVDRDFGFAECDYVAEIAAGDTLITTYIPFCPLNEAGSLDALGRYASMPLVAGVRHNQLIQMDGQVRDRRRSIESLRIMAAQGLVYELSVRAPQHFALAELAAECPDTTIVLGHLGKPRAGVPPQKAWLEGLTAVAKQPNVMCKLSCPVDLAEDPPMTEDFVHPLIAAVVERFGFDRVIFGTNFPTCNVASSPKGWMQLLAGSLASANSDELDRLYRRNARAIYRLPRERSAHCR